MRSKMSKILDRVFPERVFRRSVIERLDSLDRLQRARMGKIKTRRYSGEAPSTVISNVTVRHG